jgi:hypothetical protein
MAHAGKQPASVFQCQGCRYLSIQRSLTQPNRKEHDLRRLKEIRCAAGVLFMLATSVSIISAQEAAKPLSGSPAQEPAKAADSPPAQVSTTPFNFPDFTAVQNIATRRGGPGQLLMNVYFSGSTVRVDVSPKITNLFVTSAGKVYKMVTGPDKTSSCVVMKRDQHGFMTSPFEMLQGAKVERTPVGTDVVDGHKCKVEDVVVTRADGKIMKSKVWEADDFQGVPIKVVSEIDPPANAGPDAMPIKIAALYGDIKFEKVDPALLTPPNNCTPIEKTYEVIEQPIVK